MRAIAIVVALVGVAHANVPLADAVRGVVERELPPSLGVVEIRTPSQQLSAHSAVAVRFTTPARSGANTIAVEVGAGKSRRTVWATVRLAPVTQVVVARRALAVGDRVNSDDVSIESRATDERSPMPPASFVPGAIVKRAVTVDEVVRRQDFLVPEIARGTAVRVVVRGPGLVVATQGFLERAARSGEPALVRLAATQRLVHGRLADATTFELEGVMQ